MVDQQLLDALRVAVSTIEQLVPEPSARGVADMVLFQARAAIKEAERAEALTDSPALRAFRRWYVWTVDMDGPGETNERAFLERLEAEIAKESPRE